MKKIIIVESPAKIKTIEKFMGKDCTVLSTKGHIKDLPQKEIGVSLNGALHIDYQVLPDKDKVIAALKKAAKGAHAIYLASDPDREGEIISWHVAQELAPLCTKDCTIHRISFNEITKSAIEKALANPGVIDEHKVHAQQARRVLDRWVGYEVSPVLWRKVRRGLSAGRVQSVALKLICEREDAIRSFVTQEYWTIHGIFVTAAGKMEATLHSYKGKKCTIETEEVAHKYVKNLQTYQYQITDIKDTQRKRNPDAPFMTSTLQQVAYNRLGIAVQNTMQIAQKLYEGIPLEDKSTPIALITYMRTDSTRISDEAIKNVREYIKKQYSDAYLPDRPQVFEKKGKKGAAAAQDAHEAIRPIDVRRTPEMIKPYVDDATYKVYSLIWHRFVACQMKPAEFAQRAVSIESNGFVFKATGSTLLFDGFLKVYAVDEDEEKEDNTAIPAGIAVDMNAALESITPKQHFTQPPPRYTQATLVKDLEKEGIGRPSTYATILKTIQARDYTSLDERKRFVPTDLGMMVTKLLNENLPKIMDVHFTARLEEDLDKIAQGERELESLLREFYTDFSHDVKTFQGSDTLATEETTIVCPSCNEGKLLIRIGKTGAFAGCNRYPECSFTSNFTREDDGTIQLTAPEKPKTLDEKCPHCDKELVERVGRYGKFVACSGYPECKYVKQETANIACPSCGNKPLVKKQWKGKVFWGCSQYPKCTFSVPGDIIQEPCLKCSSEYLLKRITKEGKEYGVCPNKECPTNKTKKSSTTTTAKSKAPAKKSVKTAKKSE